MLIKGFFQPGVIPGFWNRKVFFKEISYGFFFPGEINHFFPNLVTTFNGAKLNFISYSGIINFGRIRTKFPFFPEFGALDQPPGFYWSKRRGFLLPRKNFPQGAWTRVNIFPKTGGNPFSPHWCLGGVSSPV